MLLKTDRLTRQIMYFIKMALALSYMILMVSHSSLCQESISSAGSSNQSGNYFLSWTLGEIITGNSTNSEITIYQGLLPAEITLFSVSEHDSINDHIVIYPNPTSNMITIECKSSISQSLFLQLQDINGRIFYKIEEIDRNTVNIDLKNISAGIYFLNLFEDNKLFKSYKVIKR